MSTPADRLADHCQLITKGTPWSTKASPTEVGVVRAGNDHLHLETVAVQAPAFMSLREAREQMGRFKLKGFAQFKIHGLVRFPDRTR